MFYRAPSFVLESLWICRGYEFLVNLYILPIEGSDVVLGIQWLQLLSRVSHDYAALSMEFMWNGSSVKL